MTTFRTGSMLNGRHILFCNLFFLFLFACSCGKDGGEVVLPPDPPVQPGYDLVNKKEVFGFFNQSRYSYCPSVVREDDGTVHMFFCGNPEQLIMVDNIYHVKIKPDGSQTTAKSIVRPGVPGTWDDHHICDPSVIAGDFNMNGTRYAYAMFYLTNQYGVYYNEIGVAFSNSLEADSWIKYSQRVVSKPWTHEGDELLPGNGKSWGVGQPSAVSLDKKGEVLLTFTIGDSKGTRIEWARADLSNMNDFKPVSSVRIPETGLINMTYTGNDYTCNSDIAIDLLNNKVVMVRPVQPHPLSYPAYLNESLEVNFMPLDAFLQNSGKWESTIRIAPYMTGYARNHNAGIERKPYGEIDKWNEPVIYYTVSKASPDVSPSGTAHAEWTYHIWKGEVRKR